MRVVSGTVGGRRLSVPPGRSTRPTSELVRAAMFNSLDARGMVAGAVVADLFAGSGALGIEALSRGASSAVFVESDSRAATVIEENVTALGLHGAATLTRSPVEQWARRWVGGLDLVLVDPPYGWDGWGDLLGTLATFPCRLVVAESDRPLTVDGWETVGVKRHGGTVVTQLRPRGATAT